MINDYKDFNTTLSTLNNIGINDKNILDILVGLLHLGNLIFAENDKGESGISEKCSKSLKVVSELSAWVGSIFKFIVISAYKRGTVTNNTVQQYQKKYI